MDISASVGCPDRFLSGSCFLFLFETAFQVEAARAIARPPRAPSISIESTWCDSTCLAQEAIVMTGKEPVVVQHAIAIFKNGELNLAWVCTFCGDHSQWYYSKVPPFVVFRSPIPSFCHGCQKGYAIAIRQKLTGVVTPEMNQ